MNKEHTLMEQLRKELRGDIDKDDDEGSVSAKVQIRKRRGSRVSERVENQCPVRPHHRDPATLE